jgi:effector-binding domain-containing protein
MKKYFFVLPVCIALSAGMRAQNNAVKEPTFTIEETMMPKRIVVYVSDTAGSPEEITKKFMQIIPVELGGFLKKNDLKMASPPLAWYYRWTPPFIFDIGVSVNKAPASTEGRVKLREIAAGKVVVAHFYGPYNLTGKAYDAVAAWMKQHNKTADGAPYEIYTGDPGIEKDPYKVLTDIVFPVK